MRMAAADRTEGTAGCSNAIIFKQYFFAPRFLVARMNTCEQECREYNTDRVRHCGIVDYRAVRCLAVQQAAEALRREDEIGAGNCTHECQPEQLRIQKFFFSVNRYIAAAHRTIIASVWLVQLK